MDRFLTSASQAGPRRGPRGVLLVYNTDTEGHTIICTCLRCCDWQPPGVTVLDSKPGTAEVFAYVLERNVPQADAVKSPTTNTRWICAGCGQQFTGSSTRMRGHVLVTCVGGSTVSCRGLLVLPAKSDTSAPVRSRASILSRKLQQVQPCWSPSRTRW